MTTLSSLRLSNDRAFSGTGLDSAGVLAVAGTGLTVYSTLDSLPVSSLTAGDQAYVQANRRLYISNGSGWYNVALVNATPSLSLDQSGTIIMNADTLTVTVVASATDSDDNQDMISFSVESDGNMLATGVTVSQDSSVFTITSLTEDSGGVAGDFTLTFKATDGIAVDNEALSFSLAFSNVVDSSAETILLMKADGNSANNASITFLDSDGSAGVGYNENGDPQATTFSPYRSGGYSVYLDGSGDYLDISSSSDFQFGTGAFTIECWFYAEDLDHNGGSLYPHLICINSYTNGVYLRPKYDGTLYEVYVGNTQYTFTTTIEENVWTHVAVVRDASGNLKLFENGTQIGTTQTGVNYNISTNSSNNRIGSAIHAAGEEFKGYIRDVRVTNTAVYSSDFTAPTETLTAISGTKLLCCHLPYIRDGSTSDHTITQNGNPETRPFGPYDYEPWTADDHGGSVNFDGSDSLKIDGSPTWAQFGTGNFTIECWIRREAGDGDYAAATGILNTHRAGVTSGWYLGGSSSNRIVFWAGTNRYSSNNALRPGEWTHIAAVREGTGSNQFKLYSNGKVVGTFTETTNISSYTYGPWIGSYDTGGTTWYHTGNIADMRVSNSAVYTSEFTPPTAPLTATANTVHLMNKFDANIYDAAAANSIQVSGSVTNTSTRKFTTSSSVYFDGLNDVLTVPSSPQIILGSSDFTLEGWFYPEDITPPSGLGTIASIHTSDNTGWYFSLYQSKWRFQGYSSLIFNSGSNATQDAWSHVAITRSGNNYTMWVNGTSSNTATSSLDWTGTDDLTIGYSHSSYYQGYIQDLRLTKGLARYTSTFTPPTAEFEL